MLTKQELLQYDLQPYGEEYTLKDAIKNDIDSINMTIDSEIVIDSNTYKIIKLGNEFIVLNLGPKDDLTIHEQSIAVLEPLYVELPVNMSK